jgi:3-phenylpropionate/cinnamic acid dioxygenase small subunit
MSERTRDPVLARFQVEQFLYHEARLMDGRSYDAWESLWADDGVYWVPANGDDTDPLHDVSLLYDNRARLATRIARLKSDKAHSQDPPPRLVRLVSNVEIETFEPECRVHSTFLLVESSSRGPIGASPGQPASCTISVPTTIASASRSRR